MATREWVVRILGDDRDYQRTLKRAERSTAALAGRQQSLNQALRGGLSGFGSKSSLLFGSGAFISTAGVTAALTKSISAASDLNEEISKTGVVFQESGREIEEWSKTTARALGISRVEALRGAGSIGNMLVAMGLAPARAAEMSRAMVQLASDMASFNNEDPGAMLERIRSGLSGEMEPLRRFGSVLSATRVQTFAWANGIAEAGEELTEQQKILGRYGLLMKDTTVQQGDFARTSDQLANQARTLRANFNDLSASLGGVLIPALTTATDAVNLLFEGMSRLGDVEITEGFDVRELAGWVSGWTELNRLINAARGGTRDTGEDTAIPGDISRRNDIAGRLEEENEQMQRQALEADRARRRQRRAFDALTKGLGLKLDRARITSDLSDDLDVLREIERAILRRIRAEGRTFELVERLVGVRAEIAATQEQRAAESADRAAEAWQNTLDALDLKVEIAGSTRGLTDDLAALKQLEGAILRRIQSEGRTTELLRQLFQAREEQARVREEMASRERERRQAAIANRRGNQFEALGLTREGDRRVPGTGALQRRAQSLQQQIKGTVLDTAKTNQQLDRIRAVLAGKFGKVGRDVRAAILQMLNDISSALDQGPQDVAPRAGFEKTKIGKLLAGLGLSPEEVKALRARLAAISSQGTQPTPGVGVFGFATPRTAPTGGGGGGNVIINGDVIVQDPRNADAFIRELQKRGQRGSMLRTGTSAGRNRGLG